MILNPDDKVHVMLRRIVDSEPRRHLVGVVKTATEHLAEVNGYAFLFDAALNTFQRASSTHPRVVSLTDARNLITLLPEEVDIEQLKYVVRNNRYVITDGKEFGLEVNEFGTRR